MMRFSTFFLLLLAVGLQASSQSLIQYPYNPDEDNNQNIGSPDLLGFLSYYGEPFTPEPILLDSVDLLTVIQNMNSTINSLQQSVNSLQGQVENLSDSLAFFQIIQDSQSGRVYAFRFDYGGASASGSGSRNNTDISRVVQITSSPFNNGSTTVTVPTNAGNNKIKFKFNSETSPFSSVYVIGYDVSNERYRWAHVDALERNLWGGGNNENIMTGLTMSTSAANGSTLYSNTNILTSFSSAQWQIEMAQGQTGSGNGNDPDTFDDIWAHGYIFFIFP